jgi:cell division protein FtsQ
MPVTAPADKRFLRAQVRPARKRRAWRTRVVAAARLTIAAIVLGCAGYWAASLVFRSGTLQVRRIVVHGSKRVSSSEILPLLDDLRGQNVLRADLDEHRRRLLASPWVSEAVLRRRLPSTIEVLIAERRPIGIARLQQNLYLIDEQGTVIEAYGPKHAELDLPIIDGLAATLSGKRIVVDERRLTLAVQLLRALRTRPDLVRRVSQIDVKDPRDAVVILDDDTALLRLGDNQFAERLQAYLDLAPALRERVPTIDYVDLRFGELVYVGTTGKPDPAGQPKKAAIQF